MRIRRTLPLVLAVAVIAAAVTLAVQLRKHAPPEPARLLPGADAFFYLNLNAVRKANSGKDLPAVSHDPEYERFISNTGFQFERDLDEAAFAIHYPAKWPGGGTGGSAPEVRFSEVLVGKFHGERVTTYLRQIAQSVDNYHSVDIFTILLEGRSLRVAVLSADSVAASNHDDPAVIRGIIDRSKRLASPFGGPSLLRQYYKHVQLASLVWVVARIDPNSPEASGWSAVFTMPATLVVSGSALNPLHPMAQAVHLTRRGFHAVSRGGARHRRQGQRLHRVKPHCRDFRGNPRHRCRRKSTFRKRAGEAGGRPCHPERHRTARVLAQSSCRSVA